MLCSKCGKEVKEGSKFCDNCGKSVETSNNEEMLIINKDKNTPDTETPNGTSEKAFWKKSLFLLGLGSLFALVSFLFFGNFHIITGGNDGFEVVKRYHFGFKEIFINIDEIEKIGVSAAIVKYPISHRALFRKQWADFITENIATMTGSEIDIRGDRALFEEIFDKQYNEYLQKCIATEAKAMLKTLQTELAGVHADTGATTAIQVLTNAGLTGITDRGVWQVSTSVSDDTIFITINNNNHYFETGTWKLP